MKRIILGISFLMIFAMVSTAAPPLQYHLAKDVVPQGFCVFSFKQTTCPTGFTKMSANGLLRSHPNPGVTIGQTHSHTVTYNTHTHSFGNVYTGWSNNQHHCDSDTSHSWYEAGGHNHYIPPQATPIGFTPGNQPSSQTYAATMNEQLPPYNTITICCRT